MIGRLDEQKRFWIYPKQMNCCCCNGRSRVAAFRFQQDGKRFGLNVSKGFGEQGSDDRRRPPALVGRTEGAPRSEVRSRREDCLSRSVLETVLAVWDETRARAGSLRTRNDDRIDVKLSHGRTSMSFRPLDSYISPLALGGQWMSVTD